jgi:hypothetical protein
MQKECAKVQEETLLGKISELNIDDNWKENILNCIRISKAASVNGNRYSQKLGLQTLVFTLLKSRKQCWAIMLSL